MAHFAYPRRHSLQKFFSAFPDGWPGAGLLLLRIAIAANLIVQGTCVFISSTRITSGGLAFGLLEIITGLIFLAGFFTPIVGMILAISYLVEALLLFRNDDACRHASAYPALYLVSICLALTLVGPGAFSVDARLFGRLEIIIPKRRFPPR